MRYLLKQDINSHVSLPLNIFYTHRYYDKQLCFTCQKTFASGIEMSYFMLKLSHYGVAYPTFALNIMTLNQTSVQQPWLSFILNILFGYGK